MGRIYSVAEEAAKPSPLLPETSDIVWSIIPLIVVGVVLWKFVLPRLLSAIDERTEKIEGGLAKAEHAQQQAQDQLKEYQNQLNRAREEASRIRDEARSEGQAILAAFREKAQNENERILAAGVAELQIQRQQIVNQLRSELGQNSIALAEKLLGHSLSAETTKSETVNRFIAELEASNK